MQRIDLDQIESLALAALTNSGTAPQNAKPLAEATRITEAQGIASHGLAYIRYCMLVIGRGFCQLLSPTQPGPRLLPPTK